ncbi:hypothetical protein PDJAM_G00206930 [Pangasius djambal]|uniref:Uncharacterized protein n=1 Tax=Pangasius djambal TaxID=1691987 RepID=A0ACC5YAE5_9TELE|nr:hypothetical protein [Pangasius djambal]
MNVSFLNELNDFYARFDKDNKEKAAYTEPSDDRQNLTLSSADIHNALSRINARKAAGPDGIPGRVLRTCAEQLSGVFTDIFNLSLAQTVVPACFKTTSIVPVPKHSSPACLNDYRPVALTPIVMKCFERLDNKEKAAYTEPSDDRQTLTLSSADVHNALSRINARKAAGPDGIPGRVLRACAEQLSGVFTDIFNLFLAQTVVPACFKTTFIVPVPKHSSPACLNDYRPVALTPIVMKCFERLVLAHLKTCLPPTLDPHQFAYRNNRSAEDAVSTALHCVLSHLENKNTYARMLFVDFSSAFNTVIPSKLITKLGDLGIKPSDDRQTLTLSSADVHNALSRINARKAAGPDGIPGRVLRACAEQLAGVFTDIFNLSLAQTVVLACFKTTSIVPVPKHSSPACLNDYRPVALTPIVMKCFERLVLAHLKTCLPPTLDPHQFAYRNNRSTEDAVSTALHCVLSHLENKNTYTRMLFVDFSSAFNTVIPSKLITKLGDLGISPSLCIWIMDFLTNRPQNVRSGHNCSTTITVNTGAPQGCVLSPFLYSLFTHDCKPVYGSNSIIKFADDTTVIGLISDNKESDYRAEVEHLAAWCADNNLLLNTSKTKELIVDFRKEKSVPLDPIHINGMAVERVSSFKFLGTHISENLSWSTNTSSLIKKAHQRLFFLRTLKKNHLSADILSNFYRCAIESILTNCITVWYGNCSAADRKALQRVVKTAQRITKTPLPAIEVVQKQRCLRRACNILKDSSHPAHSLFQLLPSRRRKSNIITFIYNFTRGKWLY